MKKRIAVGFFIHQLEDDYASLLMKGAVAAAEDLNINLVIFPGKVINGEYYDQEHTAFDYQYNVIYDFASEKSLDGVVVSAGTIGTFVSDEYMENFIRKFNLPLITVERKIGAYPCLRFNADGIKDIVNHLVSVHGCRRIAFVSGPEGNGDAEQRLAAYKSALADNGIEVDDKLIAHGNFSEYSVEVVDDMLDKCGIIPDAICMANDTMCVGAYKALRNRGLEPGKDILVTGYDDSPIALALNPMLTTVRASADILGYMAVTDIYNRISHIDAEEPSMKSSMILRGSCGCSEDSMISGEELVKISSDITLSETAELFVSRFIPLKPGNKRAGLCREIAEIIYRIFVYCEENAGKETEAMIVGKLDKLLRSGVLEEFAYDEFIGVIDIARRFIETKYPDRSISDLFVHMYRVALDFSMQSSHNTLNEYALMNFLISNIAKDMMVFASDLKKCYYSILHKLSRINIRSSFLYLYETPQNHTDMAEWVMPEKIKLSGYHIGREIKILSKKENDIPWYDFVENDYTPDKARIMVASVLFSNESQYGILLCDLDRKYFPFIYPIVPQIATSIMLSSMVMYLKGSLEAANDTNIKLNEMSMCDELTGVYNRRGFYRYANEEIQNARNEGLTGMLVFADVDNLKKINDQLGHDEGDYAICTAAEYLRTALRSSDIVARTGGDEFTALVISKSADMLDKLYSKIKWTAEIHNRQSEKPYNVTVSIGVCAFKCEKEVSVQDYMDMADNALYEDKKKKNTEIMKKQSL